MSEFEMDEHIILCNWAPRGLEWIREVHSKIIQDQNAPVVIIHDNPEDIDLPDKQDEAAFNDVYIVKGDPSNEVSSTGPKCRRRTRSWSWATTGKGSTPTARRS